MRAPYDAIVAALVLSRGMHSREEACRCGHATNPRGGTRLRVAVIVREVSFLCSVIALRCPLNPFRLRAGLHARGPPAGAGFFFGNLPFVRKNFTLVVLGIVAVSVVPVIYELWAARQEAAAEAAQRGSGSGKAEGGEGDAGGKPNFA
jgi:hypothetical protein